MLDPSPLEYNLLCGLKRLILFMMYVKILQCFIFPLFTYIFIFY